MKQRGANKKYPAKAAFAWWALAAAVASLATCATASSAADSLSASGRWEGNLGGGAPVPPMGWNSWNAFRTEVDEAKVMGAAQALVDSGLVKLGYNQVNLDDGWWLKRRTSDGRMQIRTNIFPSAATGGANQSSFKPFTDKLHAMGLKAGIYTDIGRNACSQAYDLHSPNLPEGTTAEREVGLEGHVRQDIGLYFTEWGFDYIKIDACGLADFVPGSELVQQQDYRPLKPLIDRAAINRSDINAVKERYKEVAAALKSARPGNDYVLSICNWGMSNVRSWGKDIGNLWRTSSDITPSWTSMLHNFDSAAKRALYAGPGHWNDPDILHIGHGEFDEAHMVEVRSHFALWAMINAPLLISYDLRNGPASLLEVLGNADLVRINQDRAGHQGVLTYDSDDVQFIVKTLGDGKHKAVALFNRGASAVQVTLQARHLKLDDGAPITLRDLWSKETVSFTREQAFTLAPHETRVFEATGKRQLDNGVYLSEIPGAFNVADDGVRQPQLDPTIHRMVDPWSNTRSGGARPQYAGWGGAQADATPFGQALSIAGQSFDAGIGVLANSRLQLRNDAGHAMLEASVGIDDSTEQPKRSARFYVYGDGKLLAQSPQLSLGAKAHRLQADIRGKRIIELVVRSAASPNERPVVVSWGDARLLNQPGAGASSPSPSPTTGAAPVQLARRPFGTLSNGDPVEAVVLENAGGMAVTLISYGATVQGLRFPDRHGVAGELALGFDTLAGYEKTPGFTNVTVGRYANRIAGAKFSLDGQSYPLSVNEAPNTLHGGSVGWDKRNWSIKQVARSADAASVTFTLTSPDGDQGFPGTVVADVTYELNNNNDLAISYSARTDKPTVVNLTYHGMLNLSGVPATRLATDAELTIESDAILPVDKSLIPAGAGMPVAGTPFDFRSARNVAGQLRLSHPQLALANGIDHNYILRGGRTATPKAAVTLEDRASGRGLKIATTEPGMQVYTGNFLDGKVLGKGGQRPTKHQSISFEAQGYPDSPNQPGFPSTRLDPGQEYRQTTVLHFYQLEH